MSTFLCTFAQISAMVSRILTLQKERFFIQPLVSQTEMAQHTVAISILAAKLPTTDMNIRWIASIKLVHGEHKDT